MAFDNLVHFLRFLILETRPAHEFIVAPTILEERRVQPILAFRKDALCHGTAKRAGLALFFSLEVVQALDEQEVGDLLDHRKRVRYTAGPETVPDTVDLRP